MALHGDSSQRGCEGDCARRVTLRVRSSARVRETNADTGRSGGLWPWRWFGKDGVAVGCLCHSIWEKSARCSVGDEMQPSPGQQGRSNVTRRICPTWQVPCLTWWSCSCQIQYMHITGPWHYLPQISKYLHTPPLPPRDQHMAKSTCSLKYLDQTQDWKRNPWTRID